MFVKLFTQILDSSIADDRRLRHFFTDLLLCADPQGFVMMTETAIARRIGSTLDEVLWGLAELEKPDPRSKTTDLEGRRIERVEGSGYGWRIINFETYKALKSAEDMRERTRERVRKHRERKALQQCNNDVTGCNASNPTKRKRKKQTQTKKNTPQTPKGDSPVDLDALNNRSIQPSTPSQCHPDRVSPRHSVTPELTGCHPATDTVSVAILENPNRTPIEPQKETRSKKPKPAPEADIELPYPSEAFREAWTQWLDHKRQIRQKMPETTIKAQFAQMIKWGEAAAIEAIRQSIANNWRGLFAPKSSRSPMNQAEQSETFSAPTYEITDEQTE